MADEKSETAKKPFFERGSFKAAVAVIGLLGGVWALLGAPKPWEVATELAANPLPLRNTEIILDASARMKEPFGKATKLAIAAEAVGRYAAADEDIGLALRRVGGTCDESSDAVVGFDDHQADDVTAAAGELEPRGRSNLALAVRTAINDFAGAAFHRPGSENQIVIFAGGGDECGDTTGQEIRTQLEQAKINPEFHVYAINVSKKELKSLKALKRQLAPVAPVQLDNANNVAQLYEAVQEDAREAEGHETQTAASGGREAAGATSEAKAPSSEENQAEAWSAPAPGALEIPEEVLTETTEEEEKEKEEEELEKEEKEEEEKEKALEEEEETAAEEKGGLQPAKEAPAEEEPAGQEGEEGGAIKGSEPVQPPPKSAPRPKT